MDKNEITRKTEFTGQSASLITQELLKEYLEYRDGNLYWVKPTGSRVEIGRQFGCNHITGYRVGKFKSKSYKEHRLVWLYHYGVFPTQLDHINGIRDDNRIDNLRESTQQQNRFNTKSVRNSTSRYKGVCWYKKSNKWVAQYKYNGKRHYLGLYETELEAAKAYDKAVEHLHGEYQVKNV